MRRVYYLFRTRRYFEALRESFQGLVKDPSDKIMWQLAIKCFLKINGKLVKDFYSLPMPLQEIKSGLLMSLYKLMMGNGDVEKCLEMASINSKITDSDQWFWIREVGHCLHRQGKSWEGVKEYYYQSLEIQESLETRLDLIQILVSRQVDYESIEAELLKLLSKYPNCIHSWALNAKVKGSVDSHKKVLKLHPYHGQSRFYLGSEKYKEGKEVCLMYLFKVLETCQSIPPKVYQSWSDLAKETGQWDFIWIGYWLARKHITYSSS